MNLSVALILAIFVASVIATLLKGPSWAFVAMYFPSLLLFSKLPPVILPHLPMMAFYAPIIGIIVAWPLVKQPVMLKFNSLDLIFLLLMLSSTTTALLTADTETAINTFRNDIIRLAAPYFLARISFRATDMRKFALYMLIFLLAITGTLALIECRMYPYFYLKMLKQVGFAVAIHGQSLMRFGFFRVTGTAEHPIYFGNMCVVLLGMVAVLAKTTGVGLKNIWVILALFAAFGCVIVSISFTPYLGMIGGFALLMMLVYVKFTRYLVVPAVLAGIVVVFAFTYHTAHQPLGEKADGDLNGSYYTRKMIIIESWKKASVAGPFGFGADFSSDDDDFDLLSVDNTYMLYTMTRGWVYTSLWLMIGVTFAWRLTLAFMKTTHRSQVFPLAAAAGTVYAIMLSMYTVWAGSAYVLVWAVMLGLGNTLCDLILYPELRADEIMPKKQRRGLPVMGAPPRMPSLGVAQVGGLVGRR